MEDIYISKKKNEPEEISFDFLEQTPPPPTPETPKKKMSTLKKIVIAVAGILLFSFVFMFTFIYLSGYTRNDLKANEYVSASELKSSPLVTNILLLGVDGNAEESSRSDSMILLSLDFANSDIKLTSFLRDSWVEIPSKGKKAKLNSACSSGGPQLVVDTLEYNFGVDIEHFVLVDFEMFTQIIDSLGGINVEVTKREADFINSTTRQTVESGKNVNLNGDEALVYCRIRKLDSDFMRTYRQRKVIGALIKKAKSTEIASLIGILADVFPLIQTDMSSLELTALAYKAVAAMAAFDIQQTRIPIDEHMQTDTIDGQWVEVLDLEKTKNYYQDFIYTNKYSSEDK